ncbi:hypothetical protein, partial [Rothia sp. ZJ1223]|uniref:hypothetical protein n=1 Tax=Rothia sp. ZJ1223 TaxID=2811098 RepID=UPI00195B90D8
DPLRQDAVLNKADHPILGILIKFLRHVPDFPIYSNGTKPGTLHPSSVSFESISIMPSPRHRVSDSKKLSIEGTDDLVIEASSFVFT